MRPTTPTLTRLVVLMAFHFGNARKMNSRYERLMEELTEGYNSLVIPLADEDDHMDIKLHIRLSTILDLDLREQQLAVVFYWELRWADPRLSWNESQFSLEKIAFPIHNIWKPNLYLYETVAESKLPTSDFLVLYSNGSMLYDGLLKVVSKCTFDVYYYPFDKHKCSFHFISWTNSKDEVHLIATSEKQQKKNDDEWSVTSLNCSANNDEIFPIITCHLHLKHAPQWTVMTLLMPSILMMVADLFTQLMPFTKINDRLSCQVSLLLGFSVFILILSDSIPARAQCTPLLAQHFISCLSFLVLSFIHSLIVVNYSSWSTHPPFVVVHLLKRVLRCESQGADGASGSDDHEKKSETESLTFKNCKHCLPSVHTVDTALFWMYMLFLFAYATVIIVKWTGSIPCQVNNAK
uniref:Neurotransmitter-gated ion-channel ligand-binding domain-containing protein n=1 Tax=Eptatretus burgeri TaxID=7764 RepID=A0A8C4Q4H6_EPTBU